MDFHGLAGKLKYIVSGGALFTGVPRPKVDFVRETLSKYGTKSGFPNIDYYLASSNICHGFFTNIKENFSFGIISEIEITTKGLCCDNSLWFLFRKGIITILKSLKVMTKIKKGCK